MHAGDVHVQHDVRTAGPAAAVAHKVQVCIYILNITCMMGNKSTNHVAGAYIHSVQNVFVLSMRECFNLELVQVLTYYID